MTQFERERLQRYTEDAGRWLAVMQEILRYPETPEQAAALSMTRAAVELVAGVKQQMVLDTSIIA